MNTKELRVEILRSGKTIEQICTAIGISKKAFYSKLRGETEFKLSEIKRISAFIGLDNEKRNFIFFGESVS